MPYASQKQAGFFHTNPEKVGGKAVVQEFDKATKGKDLPEKAPAKKGAGPMGSCCGKGCGSRKHISEAF